MHGWLSPCQVYLTIVGNLSVCKVMIEANLNITFVPSTLIIFRSSSSLICIFSNLDYENRTTQRKDYLK